MQETNHKYDYIIIGSGFGGSVSALRLAQKGYKVLVVEKGKWFKPEDFPKTNWQLRKWLWLPSLRLFGIMKMTIFRHVSIISGTGVGGGSLVYANTLLTPTDEFFESGSWAGLADWKSELKPHYANALKMLGAQKNPVLFDADKSLEQLAENIGRKEHFDRTNVAVYFGEKGREVPDPYFNGEGPTRTGCVYCGGCMLGCRFNSKNTLDKNYLYLAQTNSATILAESEVVDVKPLGTDDGSGGYEVTIKSSTSIFKRKHKFTSKGIVFSGGVLGTVKLLLSLKKKSLPRLSSMVGSDIRTNNETLVSLSTLRDVLDMSKGVAIGSILHTDDNSHLEPVRYSEGSSFWKLMHLPLNFLRHPIDYMKIYLTRPWAKRTVVMLFMQTIDSTLTFSSGLFGRMRTQVGFGTPPTPNIPESKKLVQEFNKVVGGRATSFGLEKIAKIPSTAHILGGAVMGEDPSKGVIDKNNMVFGYKNMMVVDGSMISANPGVNPSLTITAIAERAMEGVLKK